MTNSNEDGDCMAFMGHVLDTHVREAGYEMCRSIGLDSTKSHECVEKAANFYERDNPYAAQRSTLEYLDLMGHYRLMATLSATWWSLYGENNDGAKYPTNAGPEVQL